jgi:putative endonuclease
MGITRSRGLAGEALAAEFLKLAGYRIEASNVRIGGVEVDIVASDGPTQVLVEVKFRSRSDYGGAAAAIDGAKRTRLRRAAGVVAGTGAPVRIDVITIELEAEGAVLRHYRNALRE